MWTLPPLPASVAAGSSHRDFCSLASVTRNQTRWFPRQLAPWERELQARPRRRESGAGREEPASGAAPIPGRPHAGSCRGPRRHTLCRQDVPFHVRHLAGPQGRYRSPNTPFTPINPPNVPGSSEAGSQARQSGGRRSCPRPPGSGPVFLVPTCTSIRKQLLWGSFLIDASVGRLGDAAQPSPAASQLSDLGPVLNRWSRFSF